LIYEKENRYIIPFSDVPSPRVAMPEITVDARKLNFAEVETGFPEAEAVREAKRCLSCRRCLGCALCWAECTPEAIDFELADQRLDLEFEEIVLTRGQDNAFCQIKAELGYGSNADVITDLQFERMLSPAGPTQGLVLSPRDGEVPRRMAVIQGHPEAEETDLCSSLVLGVNESIVALDRTEALEVFMISPLCSSFQEKFLSQAKNISGLRLVDGVPESVERDPDTGMLGVQYSESGESKAASFDLIVILSKPKIPSEIEALSRKLEREKAPREEE